MDHYPVHKNGNGDTTVEQDNYNPPADDPPYADETTRTPGEDKETV